MLVETSDKSFGTKWIDINQGDGDRVEIRSKLVATELKVQQFKMGILRDDGSSATPSLEAVCLLMLYAEQEQSDQVKQTFFVTAAELISVLHAEDQRSRLCLERRRGQVGVACYAKACAEHETRRRVSQRASCIYLTNMTTSCSATHKQTGDAERQMVGRWVL